MSAFRDIMSIVDPTAPKTTPAPRPAVATGAPKPAARPMGAANGTAQAPQLKRKASGPVDSSQVKQPRKDAAGQVAPHTNGGSRPAVAPGGIKPNTPASVSTTPYRGTAAPAGSKVASPVVRKPITPATTSSSAPKPAAPAPKPAPGPASTAAAPKKGYLALLQKAKEKDATKPAAPAVQNGPNKILTKKERLALKAEASAAAKGKKVAPGASGRQVDAKSDLSKEKKRSVDVGYQGTARPNKPTVQVGYRGTARPSSAPASTSRGGTPIAKQKPKSARDRNDGYADWSDLDDMDDEDEEEDYASDGSSDMEGGIWDVEEEEQMALKAAKKEDAEALAEEMRLKREKEERKRKLLAMSKQAALKKRY